MTDRQQVITVDNQSWDLVVGTYGSASSLKDQLNGVDVEGLHAKVQTLKNTATYAESFIGGSLTNLKARLAQVWTGAAADNAAAIIDKMTEACQKINENAAQTASGLNIGVEAIKSAKTKMATDTRSGSTHTQDEGMKPIFREMLVGLSDSVHAMPHQLVMPTPLADREHRPIGPGPGPGGIGPGPGGVGPGPGHYGPGPGHYGPGPGLYGPGPGHYRPGPGGGPGPGGVGPGGAGPGGIGPGGIGPGGSGGAGGIDTGSRLAGLDGGGAGAAGLGGAGLDGTGGTGGLGSSSTAGLGSAAGAAGTGGGVGGAAGAGAGIGGRGMMMPHGASGNDEDERERSTWLSEDEDVWGTDDEAPGLIS